MTEPDMVNHPPHYTSDPSGVECITITRHRTFNIGNAIKYLWRAGLKEAEDESKQIEDLKKAVFYINDEITRISQGLSNDSEAECDEPSCGHWRKLHTREDSGCAGYPDSCDCRKWIEP